jgi:uncharacterized membrane protein YgdD (TMEM256/DUF423 family)
VFQGLICLNQRKRAFYMLIRLAAISAFIAAALGAFGAHGLEDRLTVEAEGWWDTATFYLLSHAVATLAIGLSGRTGWISRGGFALTFGALLFAATLYAMALGAPRWFGAITPLGGLGMLAGWAMIGFGASRT